MRERPILFSAPMARAILAGNKTQTRRVVKPPHGYEMPCDPLDANDIAEIAAACPYGHAGGRLWVRETHAPTADNWGAWQHWMQGDRKGPRPAILYAADREDHPFIERWLPSIHMPRWASRITLEITDVRVQRVQEISEDDARAEGVPPLVDADGSVTCGRRKTMFRELWDSINAKRGFGWDANPWVWALTFKRMERPDAPQLAAALKQALPRHARTR